MDICKDTILFLEEVIANKLTLEFQIHSNSINSKMVQLLGLVKGLYRQEKDPLSALVELICTKQLNIIQTIRVTKVLQAL